MHSCSLDEASQPPGRFKLNTDGSVRRGGRAGNWSRGFTRPEWSLHFIRNLAKEVLFAETLALVFGLQLCPQGQHQNTDVVEVDSKLLMKHISPAWNYKVVLIIQIRMYVIE